jgi:hypothetical protein
MDLPMEGKQNLRVMEKILVAKPILLKHAMLDQLPRVINTRSSGVASVSQLQKTVYVGKDSKQGNLLMENGVSILPLFMFRHIMARQGIKAIDSYPDPTSRHPHYLEFIADYVDVTRILSDCTKDELEGVKAYFTNENNTYTDIVIVDSPQAFSAYWDAVPINFVKQMQGRKSHQLPDLSKLTLTQNRSKKYNKGHVALSTGHIMYEIDLWCAYQSMCDILIDHRIPTSLFDDYIKHSCLEYTDGKGLIHPSLPGHSTAMIRPPSSTRVKGTMLRTHLDSYQRSILAAATGTQEQASSSGRKRKASPTIDEETDETSHDDDKDSQTAAKPSLAQGVIRSAFSRVLRKPVTESSSSESSVSEEEVFSKEGYPEPPSDSKEESDLGSGSGIFKRPFKLPKLEHPSISFTHTVKRKTGMEASEPRRRTLLSVVGRDNSQFDTPIDRHLKVQRSDNASSLVDDPNEIDTGGASSIDYKTVPKSVLDSNGFTAYTPLFPLKKEKIIARDLENWVTERGAIEPLPEYNITADGFTENSHFLPIVTHSYERLPTRARSKIIAEDIRTVIEIGTEESKRMKSQLQQLNNQRLLERIRQFLQRRAINLNSSMERTMAGRLEETMMRKWALDEYYGFIPFVIFINAKHESAY